MLSNAWYALVPVTNMEGEYHSVTISHMGMVSQMSISRTLESTVVDFDHNIYIVNIMSDITSMI